MSEKRSWLSKLFGQKARNPTAMNNTRLFNSWLGQWGSHTKLYQSDEVRKIIDRIATHAGKMTISHLKKDADGNNVPVNDALSRLLASNPNKYMTTFDFIYKIVSHLYINNNVFVLPYYEKGKIVAFYPIDATSTELFRAENGDIWVSLHFQSGESFLLEYTDLIHLRRFYATDEISGDSDFKSILHSVNVEQTALDSVANAIQISSKVLGILDMPTMMKMEDKEKELAKLTTFLDSALQHGGFIPSDVNGTVKTLSLDPKMAQKPLIEALTRKVRSYYGVSDAIIDGDYSEEQFNAFYESIIEPLSIQLSQAFTKCLFKDKARELIKFEGSPLAYASWDTKLRVIKELLPMGLLNLDESRELVGLAPLPDGEGQRRLQSLNYVNQEGADAYQNIEGETDANGNADEKNGSEGSGAKSQSEAEYKPE